MSKNKKKHSGGHLPQANRQGPRPDSFVPHNSQQQFQPQSTQQASPAPTPKGLVTSSAQPRSASLVPQQRAKLALKAIKKNLEGAEDRKSKAKNLATDCKQTATRILNAGLLPALSYVLSKPALKPVGEAVEEYLRSMPLCGRIEKGSVLEWFITTGNTTDVRRCTTETVEYLNWMARLADGVAVAEGDSKQKSASRHAERTENSSTLAETE